MAGYSATPLAKKLGIKAGGKLLLVNAPDYYLDLFSDMSPDVYFTDDISFENDVIHFFSKSADEYRIKLPELMKQIKQDGMLWVSWPKKASKVVTDITEDLIRNFALQMGLVDIKVCAVDEVWSGLKLVIPVKNRKYVV
ncbi:DUF3052 domain-containing protein [Mucilaginibacter sp. SJ]|uniref:DUF3052 domain-containing protein n=1 Tax=Mucilaginibacter sp. SJ TaxID=3029053 RepID=UPI0023AA00A2|nr:DUF3052 domain-containing protein [Mucilaginibacter sp. SJ]WEA02282.1 DUF3052 domain-containing protein [Mucilaginibacter sp. SJ]